MTGPSKSASFHAGGKACEVRVWREGAATFVQCFSEGRPISARFSVQDDLDGDFKRLHGDTAVKELVRIAVGDVIGANLSL